MQHPLPPGLLMKAAGNENIKNMNLNFFEEFFHTFRHCRNGLYYLYSHHIRYSTPSKHQLQQSTTFHIHQLTLHDHLVCQYQKSTLFSRTPQNPARQSSTSPQRSPFPAGRQSCTTRSPTQCFHGPTLRRLQQLPRITMK